MPRYIDVDEAKRCFLDCAASELRIDHIEDARAMKNAADFLDGIRTADVAPVVHGHWNNRDIYVLLPYECSNCLQPNDGRNKYCPDCGAKMDEEVSDGQP